MMFPDLEITTLKFLDIYTFPMTMETLYININVEINVVFKVIFGQCSKPDHNFYEQKEKITF